MVVRLCSQCVLQGFDGDVDADFVTVFETVGNCLRCAVDADRNAFKGVRHDPLSESFSGKTNDAEGMAIPEMDGVPYCLSRSKSGEGPGS